MCGCICHINYMHVFNLDALLPLISSMRERASSSVAFVAKREKHQKRSGYSQRHAAALIAQEVDNGNAHKNCRKNASALMRR
jgi:hypothetical protein